MTEFKARQPKGVPVGGQFATTARAETSTTLDVPTGDNDETTVQALSDLMDAYVAGFPHVADEATAIAAIAPHVPRPVAEALWQDALVGHLHHDDERRGSALEKIAGWERREARWRSDPTFTSPTFEVTEQGTNGPVVYTTAVGAKYTGWRDVAEVAKDVRADLKAAQKAGYLPEGITMAVTVSKYSGGQAMRVSIRGMSDDDIYEQDPASWSPGRRYSAMTNEIRSRVEAISGAYDRSVTDIQTDYFHVTYWNQVEVEDAERAEWRARETARLKAMRDRRAASR